MNTDKKLYDFKKTGPYAPPLCLMGLIGHMYIFVFYICDVTLHILVIIEVLWVSIQDVIQKFKSY